MKQLLMALLTQLLQGVFAPYSRIVLDMLHIEAAASGVRGIRTARLIFLGGLALSCLVVLSVAGLILLHVGLYLLLPHPANAITLLGLGGLYLLVAVLFLVWACAEKTWLKHSRVGHLAEQAGAPKSRESA